MDTELTFEELYNDLITASREELPDKYFTMKQFCADTEFSTWVARKHLEEQVDNGKLGTKTANVNGNYTRIWWFVDDKI